MSEIIFLAVLALIVIGPKELPELARTLGRFLNELKRSSSALTDDLKQHAKMDLLDLDSPPVRPKATPKPSSEAFAEIHDDAHQEGHVRFDIKPEEPEQLAFDEHPHSEDRISGSTKESGGTNS